MEPASKHPIGEEGLKKQTGTVPVDVDEALSFLEQVWLSHVSINANCFSIVSMNGGVKYRHFCMEEYSNRYELMKAVREYLKAVKPGLHVYYQVLPLAARPEKGRGSAKDVKIGRWLWCDLDYKKKVDKPEFQGCREGEDYALECYYGDSGKWIHVKRPPLQEVLKTVEEKLGIQPTIVVDSGAGYHLYFKLSYEIEASKLAKLEAEVVDALGGDPQSKDLARILRLPGSINPRVSRPVKVIYYEPSNEVDPEELERKLVQATELEKAPREEEVEGYREARTQGKLVKAILAPCMKEIVRQLKEGAKPSHFARVALAAYMLKAGFTVDEVIEVFKQSPDYDERKTRYQVEYIAKYKGEGLMPYNCTNMRELGLCVGDCGVKNPIVLNISRDLRELSDADVLKIAELLKPAYKPGYRQLLLVYLAGWLAKAKVSPVSAVKIMKTLYDSTQDQDPLEDRVGAVVYSYRKAGINISLYSDAIERVTGVNPSGLESRVDEGKLTKTGLQEILEEVLGEDRALRVIHDLSEILQALSPYRDSIIELMDYEKQIYAVANLRKLVIARAKLDGGELRYKERVAVVAPTKVIVYSNPLGGITKYEVTFEGATLRKPLVIGPALKDEIADRLRAEGLVYHSRLLDDVLSAIIQAFIRKGRAEIRATIESPGFYLLDGKLVAVKYDVEKPSVEKLREALLLLNELGDVWFKHAQDRFATVIKWGLIAPFSYVIKQKGRWIKWLYLYGDPDTGKTTLGKLVLKLWGLDGKGKSDIGGSAIDTVAKLGAVLSQWTFPVLVNEPGGALSKEEIVEMVKNSVDGLVARGKHVKGTYVEIPSLAPLMFTSNTYLPKDESLLKRFLIIHFSYGEKIRKEIQEKFKLEVEPRLGSLLEIGRCISYIVFSDPQILDNDPMETGETLIEKCYELAGLEKPPWIYLRAEEVEDPSSLVVEEFVECFKKLVNDLYARYVSKTTVVESEDVREYVLSPDQVSLLQKLKTLVEKNMIPGMRCVPNGIIVVTHQLLRELGLDGRITLKSLAELMGWSYGAVRMGGAVVKAAKVAIDQIAQFMSTDQVNQAPR